MRARRSSLALAILGIAFTAALWWWFDDAGFFPLSFLPALVCLPIAGGMYCARGKHRLMLASVGVVGGLALAVGIASLLSRVSDAWAEAALRSAIASAQGAEARPWAGVTPDCAFPEPVPPGEHQVLRRDNWFGAREFLVRLPSGGEAYFSFARSGTTWSCRLELKESSQTRTRPNKRLQLTAAVGGVQRPWPAAAGSGARRASGVRSVLQWFTRGRS